MVKSEVVDAWVVHYRDCECSFMTIANIYMVDVKTVGTHLHKRAEKGELKIRPAGGRRQNERA